MSRINRDLHKINLDWNVAGGTFTYIFGYRDYSSDTFADIDAQYDKIVFDISGDGIIDSVDFALKIPRVPKTTYSIGLIHDADFGDIGYLNSRISYSFRSKTYYTDNNLGFIDEQKILNVGFDFHTNDTNWIFSVFAKNLLNEVKHGNDTQLPFGTFSPHSLSFHPAKRHDL